MSFRCNIPNLVVELVHPEPQSALEQLDTDQIAESQKHPLYSSPLGESWKFYPPPALLLLPFPVERFSRRIVPHYAPAGRVLFYLLPLSTFLFPRANRGRVAARVS